MARSKRWIREHLQDGFVKEARRRGYRSRAAFKLEELQRKDHILRPGMRVVDLGAAPGSWSQLASKVVGQRGRIVAVDRLPIEPIAPNVVLLQGDLTSQETLQELLALAGGPVDAVLSDMAPNLSGNWRVDQPRALRLAEIALEVALQLLKPGGTFLVKLFQGEGFEEYRKQTGRFFSTVAVRKPRASRDESREIYLLAKGFRAKSG